MPFTDNWVADVLVAGIYRFWHSGVAVYFSLNICATFVWRQKLFANKCLNEIGRRIKIDHLFYDVHVYVKTLAIDRCSH